jgi:hypothetical protein
MTIGTYGKRGQTHEKRKTLARFVRQLPFEQTQSSQSPKKAGGGASIVGILSIWAAAAWAQPALHSHNDYNRHPPLFRALRYDAGSIEVDIYQRRGEILVAHWPWGIRRRRNIENLYFEPLRRILARHGNVRSQGKPLLMYLDFKESPEKIMPALHRTAERYRPMLAVYSDTGLMRNGPVHLAIEFRTHATDVYAWAARGCGTGPRAVMSFDKYARFRHKNGYRFPPGVPYRIYAGPDNRKHWRKLVDAGAGFLHTNRLKAARKFLDACCEKPSSY